jgi:HAE1 family hydrophobic/amphiphilic exporter-1
MTSESRQGQGNIRLEFKVGTPKAEALRVVSDKLREVSNYPENVDEPIVEPTDFENRDFIAWIIFNTTDPSLDLRNLQDFAEDRIKPALERIEGVSEIGVLGGRERETQVRFDPVLLAQRGVTPTELVNALQGTNVNVSAGELNDAKSAVRVRTISRYETVDDVERTVIKFTEGGPITVRDVAEVVESYKEPFTFVRSKGERVIAINAQREVGSNVMKVMEMLRQEIQRLNAPGGLLETQARLLGLDGKLSLTVVYDQTVYIDDALALVRSNIWIGGLLAIGVLLVFLRSIRSVGIIALAIPISVVGAVVAMVALGRTVNVISLAGMAFAVGMVVDNAIVVLENIYRHIELGKRPMQAAYDATKEVWGAVLASTLTTLVVFIPILLVQEEAGQLFRDIALAICAAVGLSLIVSITVIPTAAARLLKPVAAKKAPHEVRHHGRIHRAIHRLGHVLDGFSGLVSRLVYKLSGSVLASILIVAGLTVASIVGTWLLMPPSDYLPTGNRNLVFGLILPPPGYNLEQQEKVGERVETDIRQYWEAGNAPPGPERDALQAKLPQVPTFNWFTQQPGDPVTPPPLDNYFFVAFDGILFHGAISSESSKVPDVLPLFAHATRGENAPGMLAFAFQVPLFQLGGRTGSAVKIDFAGADLGRVSEAANVAYMKLAQEFGFQSIQPSPNNFNLPGPEMQIIPNRRRLSDLGLTPADLGLAVQAVGDGAIVGEYRKGGETIDLKVQAKDSVNQKYIARIADIPVATPAGSVVPIGSLADVRRATSPPQINRVDRQRAVTLQFTPPPSLPREAAIASIDQTIGDMRNAGVIPEDVETGYTGSASKLRAVKEVLLGNGSLLGTINSSLFLALIVTYLLLCVLFQSFLYPLVIMFSVPLATLGGFAALFAVFIWSVTNRYMPIQNLDVLAMLGFVILIGVVVNNAILIVHQSLNFMKGISDVEGVTGVLEPRRAIAESVRTRVRPIFMTRLTTVLGLMPLVVMPGAGSELYRGLGAVVLGGLIVSTVFTLVLVPLLLNLVMSAKFAVAKVVSRGDAGAISMPSPVRSPDA